MKKNLLCLAISLALFAPVSNANPVTADSLLAAMTNEGALSLAKEIMIETFADTQELFEKAAQESLEMSSLPEKKLFGKDKSNAQKKIDKLYNKIFLLITDQKIDDYRHQLHEIGEGKSQRNKQIAELSMQIGLEFDADKIDDIRAKIERYQKENEVLELKRQQVIGEVYERLTQYGADIDYKTVETMLVRVDADDILAQTTMFPVLSEYTLHLGKAAAAARMDLETSKKYYGMYVAVIDIHMHIQQMYLDKITYQYVPKLNHLRTGSEQLISESKTLMAQAPAEMKAIYKQNIDSQVLSLKAIDLYIKVLQNNAKKVSEAQNMIKHRYDLAKNTLETVSIAFDVTSLINANAATFEAVMNLSMPEMISFQNDAIQQEFEKLTIQLQQFEQDK